MVFNVYSHKTKDKNEPFARQWALFSLFLLFSLLVTLCLAGPGVLASSREAGLSPEWAEEYRLFSEGALSLGVLDEAQDGRDILAYYPITNSEAVNSLVKGFIDAETMSFLENPAASLSVRFRTFRYNEHIMSFLFEICYNGEASTDKTILKTKVYDLLSERELFPGDVFAEGSAYLPLFTDGAAYAFDREGFYTFTEAGGAFAPDVTPIPDFGGDWGVDGYYAACFLTVSAEPEDEPSEDWYAAYFPLDASTPPETSAGALSGGYLEQPASVLDNKKYVALTFDDGPQREYTTRLLNALAEYNAKATFFVLGHRISDMSDIILRMYQEGHNVGNHSYNHKQLTILSQSQMEFQLVETNNLIEAITGVPVVLLRPPYGEKNDKVKELAGAMNMSIIAWDIDPRDWQYFNARGIADHIIDHVTDGSIVILHDIYETSVEAAILVLQELSERDFVFVTVEELIGMNSGLAPGLVYRNGKGPTK